MVWAMRQKQKENQSEQKAIGGPERTRTSDLRFRKPLLYPAELRDHKGFFGLRCCFATELLPNGFAYRPGKGRVNARDGILLHSGNHMAVGIER
jgi:hypothetical protein